MTDLSLRMWRVTFTDGTEFITWANCVAAAEVLAKKEYTQSEIDYVWQDCGEEAQPGLYTDGRDLNELRARIADLEQALKDETHTRKLCADRMREGRERIKELEAQNKDLKAQRDIQIRSAKWNRL